MNILHMKYAVEIAKSGSINKASEALLIAQPNLSRAVKELEADLGITIFERSARGMILTPEGEEFIRYARKILSQIDEVENMYKNGHSAKQKFSVSVPRAGYISDAFAVFSAGLGSESFELFYKETDTAKTINDVMSSDYKLGIVRCDEGHDKYLKRQLDEKGLTYELVAEFRYALLMNRDCVLARKDVITLADLSGYVEVAHAAAYASSFSMSELKEEMIQSEPERCIFLLDRASQLDILSKNCEAFMWSAPVPDEILQRYGLVLKKCVENNKNYRDLLIYRKDYRLSELDKNFITELCAAKRRYMEN